MYYFVYLIIISFFFISSHYDLFMRALFEQPNGLKGDIAKTFTLTYRGPVVQKFVSLYIIVKTSTC